MAAIQDRLQWCMKHGRMTVADLALWLERSYPTIRNWVSFGVHPHGPRNEKVLEDLEYLEECIRKKRGFPVPFEITHFQRPEYIKGLRDGTDTGFSRSRSTR